MFSDSPLLYIFITQNNYNIVIRLLTAISMTMIIKQF